MQWDLLILVESVGLDVMSDAFYYHHRFTRTKHEWLHYKLQCSSNAVGLLQCCVRIRKRSQVTLKPGILMALQTCCLVYLVSVSGCAVPKWLLMLLLFWASFILLVQLLFWWEHSGRMLFTQLCEGPKPEEAKTVCKSNQVYCHRVLGQ